MHKFTKKTMAVATAAALLLGGGAAYAYWTNSGTGTGTASTGSNAGITVVQTSTVSAMAPGVLAQPLSGTFTNSNSSPVFIKTVVATATAFKTVGGVDIPGCTAADYAIGGVSVIGTAVAGEGAAVPTGTAGTWSGLTIAFANSAANQDACKDAVVTISYTTTTV